ETIDLTWSSSVFSNGGAIFRSLASGTDITVKVLPRLGAGNQKVDVGYIKAALVDTDNFDFFDNIDLGTIRIQGDLGRVDAGDSNVSSAIKAIHAGSMGKTSTQDPGDTSFQSNILGPIGNIHVTGDVDGARIHVLGAQFGNIGKIQIDGALKGESSAGSGQIIFTGKLGSAIIGDITGGSGLQSGSIVGDLNNGNRPTLISSIHVLGSITGGTGTDSGEIAAFQLHSVQVDHDLIGGDPTTTESEAGFIFGKTSIDTVKIGGSITGGKQSFSGGILSSGSIHSVLVGGDVTGGAGDSSGRIGAKSINNVQIGGNLKGDVGVDSGEISITTSIGTAKIQGDIIGGSGSSSGRLVASGAMNTITIGGNITGGTSTDTGEILSIGSIGSLHIGGNVQGGSGGTSGVIFSGGALGPATIDGDLIGGNANSSSEVKNTGYIQAGHITNLTVNNVTAGSNAGSGGIANAGAIRATQDIDTLTINGNLTGTATNNAIISAAGFGFNAVFSGADVAINSLTIKGNMDRAEILAGYGVDGTAANHRGTLSDGSAQIGTVHISGNMSASSIAAGVSAGSDGKFGTGDETVGTKVISSILAKIAAVIVDGTATGSGNNSEHFGIEAELIDAASINGVSEPLTSGAHNDDIAIGNLDIREV